MAATESATLSTETKDGMQAASENAAPKARPAKKGRASPVFDVAALTDTVIKIIDDAKAEDIVSLDLKGKTSLADQMIVASGRSDRHVGAIAERIASTLRELGHPAPRIEGMPVCDWVLIDTGDIIIHLFRPEVRGFYNLEKLWGAGRPSEAPQPESTGDAVVEKPAKTRRPPAIKAESATRTPRKSAGKAAAGKSAAVTSDETEASAEAKPARKPAVRKTTKKAVDKKAPDQDSP